MNAVGDKFLKRYTTDGVPEQLNQNISDQCNCNVALVEGLGVPLGDIVDHQGTQHILAALRGDHAKSN